MLVLKGPRRRGRGIGVVREAEADGNSLAERLAEDGLGESRAGEEEPPVRPQGARRRDSWSATSVREGTD